jgi:hypothetical protein
MRPPENLIIAWHEYLRARLVANGLHGKAQRLFQYAQQDVRLYHKATTLHKRALSAQVKARVNFHKALKQEWCKRYRVEWKNHHTCVVWVHDRYGKQERGVMFNKSIRKKKVL